eukprot:Skav218096  [mRNA]  locus=scaffold1454:59213:61713:+ [translate_table: standard]
MTFLLVEGHQFEVPWNPWCHAGNEARCPAYRWNAPLWPLPGLFLCWLLYPLMAWLTERIHRNQQGRTLSLTFLICSAVCYGLSMGFVDLRLGSDGL